MRCVWEARGLREAELWHALGSGRPGTGLPEEEGLYVLEGGHIWLALFGGEIELGSGAMFAHWPQLDRAANVSLRGDDALCWRLFDKAALERLLREKPAAYAELMAHLEKLCPAPPEGTASVRLRRLLATWWRDWGPQVAGTVSASELARLTGASREGVELILSRWRRRGLLIEEAGAWYLQSSFSER